MGDNNNNQLPYKPHKVVTERVLRRHQRRDKDIVEDTPVSEVAESHTSPEPVKLSTKTSSDPSASISKHSTPSYTEKVNSGAAATSSTQMIVADTHTNSNPACNIEQRKNEIDEWFTISPEQNLARKEDLTPSKPSIIDFNNGIIKNTAESDMGIKIENDDHLKLIQDSSNPRHHVSAEDIGSLITTLSEEKNQRTQSGSADSLNRKSRPMSRCHSRLKVLQSEGNASSRMILQRTLDSIPKITTAEPESNVGKINHSVDQVSQVDQVDQPLKDKLTQKYPPKPAKKKYGGAKHSIGDDIQVEGT